MNGDRKERERGKKQEKRGKNEKWCTDTTNWKLITFCEYSNVRRTVGMYIFGIRLVVSVTFHFEKILKLHDFALSRQQHDFPQWIFGWIFCLHFLCTQVECHACFFFFSFFCLFRFFIRFFSSFFEVKYSLDSSNGIFLEAAMMENSLFASTAWLSFFPPRIFEREIFSFGFNSSGMNNRLNSWNVLEHRYLNEHQKQNMRVNGLDACKTGCQLENRENFNYF